ncbi:MAG: uncharacterized protein A8A55_2600, partial [Amphiamblys sp. WSBS2006]
MDLERLKEIHVESKIHLEEIEHRKENAEIQIDTLLKQEKEYFSKLKFSLIEVETKQRFLNTLLEKKVLAEEDRKEVDRLKAELKSEKTLCEEQHRKAKDAIGELATKYETYRAKETQNEHRLAEIEQTTRLLAELKERDGMELEHTLDDLEKINSDQTDKIKQLRHRLEAAETETVSLGEEARGKQEHCRILEEAKEKYKAQIEKMTAERTKEEKSELKQIKNWIVTATKLVGTISGINISSDGNGWFSAKISAKSDLYRFRLDGDSVRLHLQDSPQPVAKIKTIEELSSFLRRQQA